MILSIKKDNSDPLNPASSIHLILQLYCLIKHNSSNSFQSTVWESLKKETARQKDNRKNDKSLIKV